MLASEKSAVCGKWAWVGRGKDEVASVWGDQSLFFDGEATPEQEHEVFAYFGYALDDCVGELLPSDSRMACRHVCAYGKRCV